MNKPDRQAIRRAAGANAVLYVDDEEMARKYFERTFSRQYTVLTAADADAAMEIVRDPGMHIGIVVSDYRMPGRNGGELLRQIAAEFPHVVRILVTAYADRKVLLETVNSSEVFRILEKPLEEAEVTQALRAATDLLRTRHARVQRLQAIDEALSFLAHELNTPLAAILNFTSGMQDRLSGSEVSPQQQAEVYKATGGVGDNARYCMSLLGSFIENVRAAKEQAPLSAAMSARELVRSFLDSYPLSPEQREAIGVKVKQDFEIATLPNCISLVLSSLLSNSLRALNGHAAPEISFTISAGDHPRICVSDNGPGMPRQVLERLTADPVTMPAPGSNGWGLVFSKRIMQAFGGSITIDTVPGRATTVTLHFPAAA
jgi:two-component system response regulator PhcR